MFESLPLSDPLADADADADAEPDAVGVAVIVPLPVSAGGFESPVVCGAVDSESDNMLSALLPAL